MALRIIFIFFTLCGLLITGNLCQNIAIPEQIHLSYTGNPSEMMVTWVTQLPIKTSFVEYGEKHWAMNVSAKVKEFKDSGPEGRIIYIHRAKLINLIPGKQYQYRCGNSDGWSAIFSFKSIKEGINWSPRLAVFGDLGTENPVSLKRLQMETQKGLYDIVIHDGDFAYDLHRKNGRIGDEFMRLIESVAAYIPYMTCVGDHEQAYNFSHYRERFSMPGDSEGLWYSFDIGSAHIIVFSSEVYYFTKYGKESITTQYNWLRNDLKVANLPENRAKHPWIITLAHKPMYCSSDDPPICIVNNIIRKNLEDLFYNYGVDLNFGAHGHMYERMWPLYDNMIYNGSSSAPYTNPKAPIYINLASAGFYIKMGPKDNEIPAWSAFRSSDYGFMRMLILNSTHIYIEQVSEDKNGATIDNITIVKEKHGYEAWKL